MHILFVCTGNICRSPTAEHSRPDMPLNVGFPTSKHLLTTVENPASRDG